MSARRFRTRRPRALILEPEEAAARALTEALTGMGLDPDRTDRPNAASALLILAEREGDPYELLVVSGMVAGICGIELAAALALRLRRRPGLLITSGPYAAPTEVEMQRGRCSGVVALPVDSDQLRAVVARCLEPERLRNAGTAVADARRLAL